MNEFYCMACEQECFYYCHGYCSMNVTDPRTECAEAGLCDEEEENA